MLNKDIPQIALYTSQTKLFFASDFVLYFTVLSFLFYTNAVFALCIFTISFLCIIPDLILCRYFITTYLDTREVEQNLSNYYMEAAKLNTMINIYNSHIWFLKRFTKITNEYLKLGSKAELFAKLEDFLHLFSKTLITLLSYLLIAFFKTKNILTVYEAVTAVAVLPIFFSHTVTMFSIIGAKNQYLASLRRFNALLNSIGSNKEKIKVNNNLKIIFLEFKNVLPIYLKEKISPVSFSITKGEKIMLSGKNGIGKTSLIKSVFLQNNFTGEINLKTSENKILNNKELKLYDFINNFIYLPQDFPDLNISVKEFTEIAALKNNLEIETIKKSLLEYGFDFGIHAETLIKNLSGGEKKKLLLPISFLLNRNFIILNEPTNDLDDKGFKALKENIASTKAALIVISHNTHLKECFSKIIEVAEK